MGSMRESGSTGGAWSVETAPAVSAATRARASSVVIVPALAGTLGASDGRTVAVGRAVMGAAGGGGAEGGGAGAGARAVTLESDFWGAFALDLLSAWASDGTAKHRRAAMRARASLVMRPVDLTQRVVPGEHGSG